LLNPTESESKETIDAFIQALIDIDREVTEDTELVNNAPHTTPVARLDEAKAARQPDLRWQPEAAD
jgi:glycine dehydrogenase subunit 2